MSCPTHAQLALEIARDLGSEPVALASDLTPGETLYLAHPDTPCVVEPGAARLLDGRTLGVDLEWRCAHETAATILDLVAKRAERAGHLPLAIAARAITPPPQDDFAQREYQRLLARLN